MNAILPETDRFNLAPRDFDALARFIGEQSGIRIPPAKKAMVEGRLRGRVRALGYSDIRAYCKFLFHEDGLAQEAEAIIDAITTNKTDFFREIEHFHYLAQTVLPRLADAPRPDGGPLRVWSCAASTGVEAYSLAMTVAEFALRARGLRFSVLATDICREVLETGATAIYPEALAAPVPANLRSRYLMRSVDRDAALVRIVPELRRMVGFARLNLVETGYRLPYAVQIAFCRNVLIYFDKEIQQRVLARICESLVPGGYLFVGHSETIAGLALPLRQVAPTVFERVEG